MPNNSFHQYNQDMPSLHSDTHSSISFVTSNKNKRLLVIDGYVYRQNKVTSKVVYWICEQKGCRAGVHLSLKDIFIKYANDDHSHMPVSERLEIRRMMTTIKHRVNSETSAIGQIYTQEMARANLSPSALAFALTAKQASK